MVRKILEWFLVGSGIVPQVFQVVILDLFDVFYMYLKVFTYSQLGQMSCYGMFTWRFSFSVVSFNILNFPNLYRPCMVRKDEQEQGYVTESSYPVSTANCCTTKMDQWGLILYCRMAGGHTQHDDKILHLF